MKLTDEQLAQHHIIANRVWAGTRYHYPLIEELVNELLDLRALKRAAEDVYNCQSPSTIAALKKALEKCDRATK